MDKLTQENKDGYQDNQSQKEVSFFGTANSLMAEFPERTREIIKKRFGLTQEKTKTLEKIGQDYEITRERVRQIITDTVNKLSKKRNSSVFKKAEDQIVFTIGSNSGIIKESEAVKKLASSDYKEANSLIFLRKCSSVILTAEENGFEKIWFLTREKFERAKKVGSLIREVLKNGKKLLSDAELVKKIYTFNPEISEKEILNCAGILSDVEKNKFGKWGMSDWMEIRPKGTRERIYTILKERGKPLHFREIAKLIDQYGLSKKKAHVQTVHNELIKNDRFVLIGRGIYALKEWGYTKGTISDVLENILKKSKRSLSKEDILKEVLRMRQVKKATVLINLSNDKLFVKQNNLYSPREIQKR